MEKPGDNTLAVFVDFENLALGFKDRKSRFQINLVLDRLVEKGKIIVKKAYADWHRYSDYKRELHEHAMELIEIPKRAMTGKNSADIRMVVDVMDLAFSKEHINTFALVSGDSDMSPLVSKLKENGKHVIGIGMKDSTSKLLIQNCDEFIFYEDLEVTRKAPAVAKNLPKQKREAFELLIETIDALLREDKDVLWGSMIKQTMKRKKPEFSEGYVGYGSFSELLEDAEKEGLIKITKDARSGTYVVTGYGKAAGVK
ncbi:MAG: NYN domain-containing protein [Deltaproteobacteria bacterium]|nr:NYN domain-containing protein [Deltaproteobacteria bacterium]